jgi:hypothetical protein
VYSTYALHGQAQVLKGHSGPITALCWAANDQRLASCSTSVRIVPLARCHLTVLCVSKHAERKPPLTHMRGATPPQGEVFEWRVDTMTRDHARDAVLRTCR